MSMNIWPVVLKKPHCKVLYYTTMMTHDHGLPSNHVMIKFNWWYERNKLIVIAMFTQFAWIKWMDTQFKMRYRVLVNSADASKVLLICNVACFCHLRLKKQNNTMVDIYIKIIHTWVFYVLKRAYIDQFHRHNSKHSIF